MKYLILALALMLSGCFQYEYIQGKYIMTIYNRSVEICRGVPKNINVDSGQYSEYTQYTVLVECADYNAEFIFKGVKE